MSALNSARNIISKTPFFIWDAVYCVFGAMIFILINEQYDQVQIGNDKDRLYTLGQIALNFVFIVFFIFVRFILTKTYQLLLTAKFAIVHISTIRSHGLNVAIQNLNAFFDERKDIHEDVRLACLSLTELNVSFILLDRNNTPAVPVQVCLDNGKISKPYFCNLTAPVNPFNNEKKSIPDNH